MADDLINGWWTAREALGKLPDLRGAALVWKPYAAPSDDWDHDHCELCSTKLMETAAEPGVATSGYTDGIALPGSQPFMRTPGRRMVGAPAGCVRWICPVCAEAYRAVFGWTTVGGPTDL